MMSLSPDQVVRYRIRGFINQNYFLSSLTQLIFKVCFLFYHALIFLLNKFTAKLMVSHVVEEDCVRRDMGVFAILMYTRENIARVSVYHWYQVLKGTESFMEQQYV